jgi:hypothetical protein
MEHTIFATNKERAYEIWGREGKWGQEDQNELLEWKRKTRSFFFGGTRGGTLREAKIAGEGRFWRRIYFLTLCPHLTFRLLHGKILTIKWFISKT